MADILLTTPESLEAMFVLRPTQMPALFGKLAFVVIDELHAFIGQERGKQLQSLLHRIDAVTGRAVRRVGLSATLGDMGLAAEFLRPGGGDDRENCRVGIECVSVYARGSESGGRTPGRFATFFQTVAPTPSGGTPGTRCSAG